MGSRFWATIMVLALGLTLACGTQAGSSRDGEKDYSQTPHQIATLAGGCFWCVESAFDGVEGVLEAVSGYTGGEKADPTYEEVSSGRSGHIEAVRIRFQSDKITYEEILDIFWRQIDPTDPGGQFADRGSQYRTAVFYHDEDQHALAVITRDALGKSGRFDGPIVTEIAPAGLFYAAETYHQDYAQKNPEHYKRYRFGSGRTPFLERIWGADAHAKSSRAYEKGAFVKPREEELRNELTPLQYHVTQEEGTERAFANEYWDNKGEGLYVDIVSGEPLFSSQDKFESGTGWPSFTRPLEGENIVEKRDTRLFMERTEVRSKQADSHLGHLFPDGPKPTGQRYCINSAALRFIPKDDLEQEGYGKYLGLFERSSDD